MSLAIVLGTIGMVAALIIRVAAAFPGADPGVGNEQVAGPVPADAAGEFRQAVAASSNAFERIIDDLISHQTEPDYERAVATRDDMVRVSDLLMGDLQALEETLLDDLEGLTAHAQGLGAEGGN